MPLLDYRHPNIRRGFRIAAAIVLAIGIAGLVAGHVLQQHIVATGQTFRDAAHPFFVPDRYYVSSGLGLARNLTLIVSVVLSVSAFVVLLHRELRWYFWDRYLQKDSSPSP